MWEKLGILTAYGIPGIIIRILPFLGLSTKVLTPTKAEKTRGNEEKDFCPT